jgi:alkylation response protein AidB-like acyl-CoA dehydrogenase
MSAALTEILPRNDKHFEPGRRPDAYRIASDQEALTIARDLARKFAPGAAERDRERILPKLELDEFSGQGLWAISIPKAYGGAGVSHATIVEVFRTIAEADPSIAQIAHNHFCVIDAIRLDGSEMRLSGLAVDRVLADPNFDTLAAASVAVAEAKVLTTEISLAATNKLFELSGTASTLAHWSLDRHWRNARTHTLHDPVRWKYFAIGNFVLNEVRPPRNGAI